MADYTEQERAELQRRVMEDMRAYGNLHHSLADELRDSQIGVKGFSKTVRYSSSEMGRAWGDLTKQTYNGAKGLTAFNDVITTTATAMGALVAVMGGPVIGTIAIGLAAFAKVLGTANDMQQRTFNSYKQLAEVGGSAGTTLQGLRDQAKALDYTLGTQEEGLQDFTNLIAANAETLANFKGSVSAGVNGFADLSRSFVTFRDPLLKLGLNTEAQNKSILNYISYSQRLGQTQGKTNEQLATSARKYIMETEALATLTGQRREDIEAQRRIGMAEQQFRAKIEGLRSRNETETADRLEKFNTALQVTFHDQPMIAKGMRQLAASGLQAADAQRLNFLTNGEALEVQQLVTEGKITEAQGIQRLQDAIARNLPVWNELATLSGDLTDVTGDVAKMYDATRVAGGKAGLALDAAALSTENQTRTQDKGINTIVEIERNQKEAAKSLQGVIEKFIEVASELTLGLSSLWKSITGTMGDIVSSAGTMIDFIKYDILKMEKTDDMEGVNWGEKFTAAFKDMISLPGRGLGGAYNSAVVRPLRAMGADVNYTSEEFMGGDSESMTPYMDELRRRAAANKKAKAAAASTAPAAPPSTTPAATAAAAPGAPARKGYTAHSNQSLAALGLTLTGKGGEKGDRQAEGAQVSDKLIELAQKIKSNIPGFAGFTGFNDNFHREEIPNSGHAQGLSVDFVLNKRPTREEGQKLVDMLKSMGASVAKDEYNDPSSKATGPHFHASVPEGRYGGIFEGPRTGYAAVMHGREAILPLPNGQSIPIAIDTEKIIESFSEALKRTSSSSTSSSGTGTDLLSAVLDMVRLQRDQNDLVSRLLQVQRA